MMSMPEELTPLWRFKDYVNLTHHKNHLVHQWADKRLRAIEFLHEVTSPETAAEWLHSQDEVAAALAAGVLGEVGAKEYAGALLNRFETAQGVVAAACADTLARLGVFETTPKLIARLENREDSVAFVGVIEALDELRTEEAHVALRSLIGAIDDPQHLASLFGSLLKYLCADDAGLIVEKYLGFKAESQDRLSLLRVLSEGAAVEDVCWHLENQFQAKGERLTKLHGEAGRAAKRLGMFSRGVLSGCMERRDYVHAISQIAQKAKDISVGQSRYQQVLRSFIQAFEENLSRLVEDTLEPASLFLLACLIRLLEEVPEWSPQDRPERLINILHYNGVLPLEDELIEKELPSRRSEVTGPLLEVLKRKPESAATPRAAGALGGMREARAVPWLLEHLKGETANNEVYERALARIGSPVLAYADPVLKGDDTGQKISLVAALRRIPFEETVDLLLNHYESLVRETPDMLLSALEDLGSRRTLPIIERDIGKGEATFDDAFLLLCELHDVKHPMLSKLRTEHERRQQRGEAFIAKAKTKGLDALLMGDAGPLHLKLKCCACGRIYTYDIEEVFVSPEQMKRKDSPADSAYFIRERIICKNCGAEDEYSFTNKALVALMGEMMILTAAMKQKGTVPEESQRLKIADFRLMDGTRCTPREALEIYKRRLEADPNNPAVHVGMANIYGLFRRHDQALAHFQRALELDPDYLETLYHMANMHMDMGQEKKAMCLMEEFLSRAAKKPKLTPRERECFQEAKEALGLPDEFEDVMLIDPKGKPLHRPESTRTEGYVPAKRPEPTFKGRDVRPNEFCPCGSGKKYKKCCMLRA